MNSFVPSHSAVVLCNESLLLPVLHAIPESISDINVTMGFPLAQTPLYDLIDSLVTMQTKGYDAASGKYRYSFLLPVLRHSYITKLTPNALLLEKSLTKNNSFFPKAAELHRDEMLKLLFTPAVTSALLADYLLTILTQLTSCFKQSEPIDNEQPDEEDFLGKESLFKAYILINSLRTLIQTEGIELKTATLHAIAATDVVSSNHPVSTANRCADCRSWVYWRLVTSTLTICSYFLSTKGSCPRWPMKTHLSLTCLRKSFGLTTIEHTNSLYAYYFFRALQRATNITLMYNTASDGMNRGEMSLFLLQLLAESDFPVRQLEVHSVVAAPMEKTISIPKTPEIIEILHQKYDLECNPKAKILSPSALNKLIDCSLQFYFHHIAGLKQEDEVTEDIDNAMFGTIFHKSAELLYQEIKARTGGIVTKEYLELYEKNPLQIEDSCSTRFFRLILQERDTA